MLLSSIEWLAVKVNGGSVASLWATQLTLATKLLPGDRHNGPVKGVDITGQCTCTYEVTPLGCDCRMKHKTLCVQLADISTTLCSRDPWGERTVRALKCRKVVF